MTNALSAVFTYHDSTLVADTDFTYTVRVTDPGGNVDTDWTAQIDHILDNGAIPVISLVGESLANSIPDVVTCNGNSYSMTCTRYSHISSDTFCSSGHITFRVRGCPADSYSCSGGTQDNFTLPLIGCSSGTSTSTVYTSTTSTTSTYFSTTSTYYSSTTSTTTSTSSTTTTACLGQGTGCSSNSECCTGHCVDGYCCNSACTGTCQRCDGYDGPAGTCHNIGSGHDPDNECPLGSWSCYTGCTRRRLPGYCSGTGSCAGYVYSDCSAGTACSGGSCLFSAFLGPCMSCR